MASTAPVAQAVLGDAAALARLEATHPGAREELHFVEAARKARGSLSSISRCVRNRRHAGSTPSWCRRRRTCSGHGFSAPG
jgi:hypothetical protein